MKQVSRGLDRIAVAFDDPSLVANAGLLLVSSLVCRLGLESLIDDTVRLTGRAGGFRPGRKVLSLVHAIVAGASHIDHADMLRAGATKAVLSRKVMAPSTLGTFLRSFSFGHVRQLEVVIAEALRRALVSRRRAGWSSRGRRGLDDLRGRRQEEAGASYGYTHVLGYHPLLATQADTGEVLHARMRKGSANTARGTRRFIEELVPRLRRAGASGEIVCRLDSGFWSNDTLKTLSRLKVSYTMAVRTGVKTVAAAISRIDEDAWVGIDYTSDGIAEVAETTYKGRRLVVRRTRLVGPQQKLWPDWRHFAFVTDLAGSAVDLDAVHRDHARVELAIRDLKEGAGMEHVPSGHFFANSAWLCCAVLAHDLMRWCAMLGGVVDDGELAVARTLRTRLFSVHRSGTPTLRGPKHWPWAETFCGALSRIRMLDLAPS